MIYGEQGISRPYSYAFAQQIFLRGLGFSYLLAFTSSFAQVDGLYGETGILPLVSGTTIMDGLCVAGMILAAFVAGFGWANIPSMVALLWIYKELLSLCDGPFYTYFVDSYLLEVGVLGILYAPLWSWTFESHPGEAPRWLIRFVLFKLLIIAGLQQLTGDDEAWYDLTAIKYFLVCQTLPSPVSWYLHLLPTVVQEIMCSVVFVIELPVAVLIILPWPHGIHIMACVAQVCFQAYFFLIGSFGFLNLLALIMALALLDDSLFDGAQPFAEANKEEDHQTDRTPLYSAEDGREVESYRSLGDMQPSEASDALSEVTTPRSSYRVGSRLLRSEGSRRSRTLRSARDGSIRHTEGSIMSRFNYPATQATSAMPALPQMCKVEALEAQVGAYLASISCVFCIQAIFFLVSAVLSAAYFLGLYTLDVSVSSTMLLDIADVALPVILVTVVVFVCIMTLSDVAYSVSLSVKWGGFFMQFGVGCLTLARGAMCAYVVFCSASPLGKFSTTLDSWSEDIPSLPFGLSLYIVDNYTDQWMGVTYNDYFLGNTRPEINIDVLESNGTWTQLEFKYKPVDVNQTLPVLFTYQPRLDWQMWFQAREAVDRPWFTSLLDAILDGEAAALCLLKMSSLPTTTIDAVRTRKWNYSMTKSTSDSEWWKREMDPSNDTNAESTRPAVMLLQESSSESLYEIAESYTSYRMLVIVLFFLLFMVFALWSTIVRTWRKALNDDHGQASSYDQSTQAAQLSLTTSILIILLVILCYFVSSTVLSMIVIWVIVCGGIAVQAVANRASRDHQTFIDLADGYVAEVPKPHSPSRLRTLHYLVLGVLVVMAFAGDWYICWLLFGIGVWAAAVLCLVRTWVLIQATAPVSTLAGVSVDVGLLFMLIITDSYWENK